MEASTSSEDVTAGATTVASLLGSAQELIWDAGAASLSRVPQVVQNFAPSRTLAPQFEHSRMCGFSSNTSSDPYL
jgi:hypothetical protein